MVKYNKKAIGSYQTYFKHFRRIYFTVKQTISIEWMLFEWETIWLCSQCIHNIDAVTICHNIEVTAYLVSKQTEVLFLWICRYNGKNCVDVRIIVGMKTKTSD